MKPTDSNQSLKDIDSLETREWLDAIDSVIREAGSERARYLIEKLSERATRDGSPLSYSFNTPFRNTIPVLEEEHMPGDLFMERRIRSLVRWNALATVMRANQREGELGGHISSFSSSATLYDVAFNYFFRAPDENNPECKQGDLIYFQGHIAPGIYARSYLEGRINEEQLDNYRQEVDGKGLSSYPHPWLMPDYWQFPTVSMGLGPIQSIYQAHFMRYLSRRSQVPRKQRKVWAFLGDGECDEPETLGAISLAGREHLENLIFVINCNLQRLDGPVRGNGKIIQELEGVFRGAGWNVIKVVWGRHWDPLLARDDQGVLQQRMDEVVDGEFQNYKVKGGAYTRKHFFGEYPELEKMVEHLSDEEIYKLNRGGHDPYKVYAAYAAAMAHKGQPTVILAHTIKGYGVGAAGEAQNATHSLKKLDLASLKKFRDRFDIPLSDEELETVPYYRPPADSPEMLYMKKRRDQLGGFIPQRTVSKEQLPVPELNLFKSQLEGSGEREISTTMAFVRILSSLTKDKQIGERVVPIVPDEARTFGMEGMFRQLGIYSAAGQLYDPVDSDQIMYYREDKQGQILEEGINEAGAFSAWMAAATSYSTNTYAMVPFYIFYSMFGFQRVGDLAWAAGDCQARGFLIGATSGRTTLNGEGLQHQDGHSHILASTIPNCVCYDPAYAYELAVIIQYGLKRMLQDKANEFFYITSLNENYQQPAMPEGVEEGIIKGLYPIETLQNKSAKQVELLGSGAILREVLAAAELLQADFGIETSVWSVTSFNELRKEALACQRWNMLNPSEQPKQSYVAKCLGSSSVPLVAATDYMKIYSEQIREFVGGRTYKVLGTDGFGRSDTRQKLRHFFEVDRYFIVLAALTSLLDNGQVGADEIDQAIKKYGIDPEKVNPLEI